MARPHPSRGRTLPLLVRIQHHPQRVPIILLLLTIAFLLLLPLLNDGHHGTLRLPSLLPTHYPPIAASSRQTAALLQSLSESFQHHCPAEPYEPIYPLPDLTPAQRKRYDHLRHPRIPKRTAPDGRYLFTTLTRDIQAQLPDLLNALVLVTAFLGPDKVAFSILEGPSGDCTPDVLEKVLYPALVDMGVPASRIRFRTREPKVDFSGRNRIEALAELRNRALEPLYDEGTEDTIAVVFYNDVFLRASDILEVLHQHVVAGTQSGLETGITAAMDYYKRRPEYFYDIWVARTWDTGDLFYPIDHPWWSPSDELFHNSSSSLAAYRNLEPFPAFSAWNGMVVLSPVPLLAGVRLRRGDLGKGECSAAECSQLASDYWKAGFGRVQIVPSVQLTYWRDVALDIRDALEEQQKELGWKNGVPPKVYDKTVKWPDGPPEKVRCHPWPEVNGLSANVWEETRWVDPWID